MRQRLLILALILFLAQFVSGQATGYMGKRFGIYYQPVIGLGSNVEDVAVTTYNLRHVLSADFAVARAISIGASFQYLHTAEEQNFIVVLDEGNINDPDDDQNLLFSGDIGISAYYYTAYVKFFDYRHAGAIAPNGRFHKVEIGFFTLDYKTISESTKSTSYDPYLKIEDAAFTIPAPAVALFYTYGRQFIFSDKFIFTTGGQLGISSKILHLLDEKEPGTRPGEDVFQHTLNGRVAGAMALGFQIGIGFIN